jgi:hypothetical protein
MILEAAKKLRYYKDLKIIPATLTIITQDSIISGCDVMTLESCPE